MIVSDVKPPPTLLAGGGGHVDTGSSDQISDSIVDQVVHIAGKGKAGLVLVHKELLVTRGSHRENHRVEKEEEASG